MTTNNNVFETTAVRNIVRGAVSSAVGALVAWGTTKWASVSASNLSYLVPVFSTAYFAAVHFLEKKYPNLGWLLGVLPQDKTVVAKITPTPAPAPSPAPAPAVVKAAAPAKVADNDPVAKKAPAAKKATAVKKAAPKKK